MFAASATAPEHDIKSASKSNDKPVIYFPPRVKSERLKSNGKLLDDAEIKKTQDLLKDKSEGRFSKEGLSDYGIIKAEDGTLFAIYNEDYDAIGQDGKITRIHKEVELGSGAFGKTKLAQNLTTGEWYVLKTVFHDDLKRGTHYEPVKEEVTILHELENTDQQSVYSRPSKTGLKRNILMKYAKGIELYNYMADTIKLAPPPFLLLLRIALEVLKSYRREIFEKGFFHRDIKIENIIFDLVNFNASFVDVAFALKYQNKDAILPFKRREGTFVYIAPEIMLKQDGGSQKSEIYALAVTLSLILFKVYPDELSPYHSHDRRIEIVKFVGKMYDSVASQRPDLDVVINTFENLEKEYRQKHVDEIRLVEEYLKKIKDAENQRLAKFNSDAANKLPPTLPMQNFSAAGIDIKKQEYKKDDSKRDKEKAADEKMKAFVDFSRSLEKLVTQGISNGEFKNINQTQSLLRYAVITEKTFFNKSKARKAQAGFLCNVLQHCYKEVNKLLLEKPMKVEKIQQSICHVYNVLGMQPLNNNEIKRQQFDRFFGFDRNFSIKDKNSMRLRYENYLKPSFGKDELRCFIAALDELQIKLADSLCDNYEKALQKKLEVKAKY